MALKSDGIVNDARTILLDRAPHAEMSSDEPAPRREFRLPGLRPLRLLIAFIIRELRVYRLITRDSRTPRGPKVLLWMAVAYAVWPLGLVPDLIPIVGYVDDIIIVPILVVIALRNVPREVILDCRAKASLSGS
jgi:uncharacterized membrane protein YkvA (DUF1232 family)